MVTIVFAAGFAEDSSCWWRMLGIVGYRCLAMLVLVLGKGYTLPVRIFYLIGMKHRGSTW